MSRGRPIVFVRAAVIWGVPFDLGRALRDVLKSLGPIEVDSIRGVAGSQDLYAISVTIEGQTLNVVSETYMGLSIGGPTPLVQQIAKMVRERVGGGA
jgi:hypothetical protein